MILVRANISACPSRIGCTLRALDSSTGRRRCVTAFARLAHTAAPVAAGKPARSGQVPKLSERQWPWLTLDSPRHKGQHEEERVIYARPGIGSHAKGFWALAIMAIGGISTYYIIPSPREARERGFVPTEDIKPFLGIPGEMFWTYVGGGGVAIISALGLVGLLFPSRIITRLSLIRSRPQGAPTSQAKEYLRLRHLGHDMMWGKRGLSRELPVEDVSVGAILGRVSKDGQQRRLPTLKLKVNNSKWNLFDRAEYRLDFRNTPNLDTEKGEVVLSIDRLEDVFGRLPLLNFPQSLKKEAVKLSNAPVAPTVTPTDWSKKPKKPKHDAVRRRDAPAAPDAGLGWTKQKEVLRKKAARKEE